MAGVFYFQSASCRMRSTCTSEAECAVIASGGRSTSGSDLYRAAAQGVRNSASAASMYLLELPECHTRGHCRAGSSWRRSAPESSHRARPSSATGSSAVGWRSLRAPFRAAGREPGRVAGTVTAAGSARSSRRSRARVTRCGFTRRTTSSFCPRASSTRRRRRSGEMETLSDSREAPISASLPAAPSRTTVCAGARSTGATSTRRSITASSRCAGRDIDTSPDQLRSCQRLHDDCGGDAIGSGPRAVSRREFSMYASAAATAQRSVPRGCARRNVSSSRRVSRSWQW